MNEKVMAALLEYAKTLCLAVKELGLVPLDEVGRSMQRAGLGPEASEALMRAILKTGIVEVRQSWLGPALFFSG